MLTLEAPSRAARIAAARLAYMSGEARRLREASRLTQHDIARQLGCSQTAVAGWEQGTRRPHSDLAVRAADLLDELRSLVSIDLSARVQ